jgi:transposase
MPKDLYWKCTRHRPHRIMGDKGYSSRRIRRDARQHGIRITIPRKRNEGRTGPFNRALYRLRNRIERLINRCKQFRRLATRYEKCAANYKALWLIAATILWLGVLSTLQTRPRNPPGRSKEQGTETLGLTGLRLVLCPL